MPQVTLRIDEKSIKQKFERLKKLAGDTVENKLVNYASYGIEISPVDTGAYVENMSIRPRGSSGGRLRRADIRGTAPDKQAKKEEAKSLIRDDMANFKDDILKAGGAVIINRSPHGKDVEKKYEVFGRMRAKFR